MKEKITLPAINYAKAFAIILVIFGHSLSYYNTNINELPPLLSVIMSFIYLIHVPLFFAVAGYLCHKQNLRLFYIKKINRLLIPFITFVLLKLFYSNVISDSFAHGDSIFAQLFDAFIYGSVYWFVYSLFFIYLLSPVLWLHKFVSYFAIVLLVIFNVLNHRYNFMRTDVFTPFQIGRTSQYSLYFVIGYAFKQLNDDFLFLKRINKYVFSISGFVLSSLLFILSLLKIMPDNYFISLGITCSLMAFIVGLCMILPPDIAVLNVFSKYSLQCMFLDSFYKVILYILFLKIFHKHLIIVFIAAFLNSLFCLITSIFLNKMPEKFKFLFGL